MSIKYTNLNPADFSNIGRFDTLNFSIGDDGFVGIDYDSLVITVTIALGPNDLRYEVAYVDGALTPQYSEDSSVSRTGGNTYDVSLKRKNGWPGVVRVVAGVDPRTFGGGGGEF